MRRHGQALAALMALLLGGVAGADEPARFALVIGQNGSDSASVHGLRYADDDAVATAALLEEAGAEVRLLVEPDQDTRRLHPTLTTDGPPRLETLLQSFVDLVDEMGQAASQGLRVEFLLFYSGHGNIEHGEGYVVLEDGRLTRSVLLDELLARSPADRNHVIVDACKSYFLVYAKGPGGERSPYLQPFASRASAESLHDTGFVLSASSGRDSHEWERYQAGVFSHEVRSGLRGGADADRDGRVTYAELGAFLATANLGIANPRYRPRFLVRAPGPAPGEPEQEILAWGERAAALELDAPDAGQLSVEDATGVRLLDVHPRAGQTLGLQLPASRPLFVQRAGEGGEYEIAASEPVRLSALQQTPVRVARKGALHLAFEKLFSEPFAADRVARWTELYRQLSDPLGARLETGVQPLDTGVVRETALWTALGAAGTAVGLNLIALQQRSSGEGASQLRRVELNETIGELNTAAVVFYSLAGAAAASWLLLYLLPDDEGPRMSVLPAVGPDAAGALISLEWSP